MLILEQFFSEMVKKIKPMFNYNSLLIVGRIQYLLYITCYSRTVRQVKNVVKTTQIESQLCQVWIAMLHLLYPNFVPVGD